MHPAVTVPKLWGYEYIFANHAGQNYCGKKLVVFRNHRISLQRHFRKDETFMVLIGPAYIELGLPGTADYTAKWYNTNDRCHIPVGTWHRLSAPHNDVHVIEVSTFHDDDDIERREIGGYVEGMITFCVGGDQYTGS